MNAQMLYIKKDGKTVDANVYYCSKCSITHRTKEDAEQCCQPYKCRVCGTETEMYHLICRDCDKKKELDKINEQLKNAEEVPMTKMIYDPFGCRHYHNQEDMECDFEECDMPEFVFACKEVMVLPENLADHVVENVCEYFDNEMNFDEDYDGANDYLIKLNELKNLVRSWAELQTIVAYHDDVTKKVRVRE